MAKHKPAGGLGSKNVVRKPVRQGSQRERVHGAGAAQQGQRQGDKAMSGHGGATGYRGESLITGQGYPSRLGNEVAESTKAGPGGSRDVYKSGFQQTHGAPAAGNPTPKAKELWPGWK
jgi:hypothetical protein